MSTGEQYSPHNFKRVSAFSPRLFAVNTSPTFTSKWKDDIAFDGAPCIQQSLYPDVLRREFMTRKGSDGQVGHSSTQGIHVFIAPRRLGRNCFTNFVPRASLKMADNRTGSVRDVCFEVLFRSMNNFCVVIDGSSIDRYQPIQSTNFIDWFFDHRITIPRDIDLSPKITNELRRLGAQLP